MAKLELWMTDAVGRKGSDLKKDYVGKVFLHLKSRVLYQITGVVRNSDTDIWELRYSPFRNEDDEGFDYVRNPAVILDATKYIMVEM